MAIDNYPKSDRRGGQGQTPPPGEPRPAAPPAPPQKPTAVSVVMTETDAKRLLTLLDRYSKAEQELNRSLDELLPNGCRVEAVDSAAAWKHESARRNLESLGMPWVVIGRTIEATHVSVQRADGTKSLHMIRRLVATVDAGLCRIVK